MPHYTYLIIGGGMTADAAVRGIRKLDANGTIGIVSADHYPPYNRPPLSKGLWFGKSFDKIWRGTEQFNVGLHLGRTVTELDLGKKIAVDDQGQEYRYEKVLLATGSSPRRFPFGGDEIIYFRTLDDYKRLQELSGHANRFLVVGGGFIGSEIAAALAHNGKQVTMVFPEAGISARVFPHDLSQFLNDFYTEKGITVIPNCVIAGLERQGSELVASLEDVRTHARREIRVDGVVAGLGVTPNTQLAESVGLEVANGVVVDQSMRTGHPDVYAAGDLAAFYNAALDKRIRVEHEDMANSSGNVAGEAMAGGKAVYNTLPYFYSDLFDLGYEAVGELHSDYQTFLDWIEPYKKGVVYYLQGGRVRGVLLWNVWGQVDNARALIAEPGPFDPGQLKGRLPA